MKLIIHIFAWLLASNPIASLSNKLYSDQIDVHSFISEEQQKELELISDSTTIKSKMTEEEFNRIIDNHKNKYDDAGIFQSYGIKWYINKNWD